MFDTHAHVNFKDFKEDSADVIQRALRNNTKIINVGSQYSTSERAVRMANQYPEDIYAAVGIHPIHLSEKAFKDEISGEEEINFRPRFEEFKKEKYFELAQHKKVVAIGEIGLDYFHNKENKEKQKTIFTEQVDLAIEAGKPIIIHCRDENFDIKHCAHRDIIKILREKKKQYKKKLQGVVHCFSGSSKEALTYRELGFWLGFNGIITFSSDYNKVLKSIDLKQCLLETDCPYLTPAPFRGKRNEPLYVKYVAEKIAEIKNISFSEVEKITDENASKLFKV